MNGKRHMHDQCTLSWGSAPKHSDDPTQDSWCRTVLTGSHRRAPIKICLDLRCCLVCSFCDVIWSHRELITLNLVWLPYYVIRCTGMVTILQCTDYARSGAESVRAASCNPTKNKLPPDYPGWSQTKQEIFDSLPIAAVKPLPLR
jgi:hypothetical protein